MTEKYVSHVILISKISSMFLVLLSILVLKDPQDRQKTYVFETLEFLWEHELWKSPAVEFAEPWNVMIMTFSID